MFFCSKSGGFYDPAINGSAIPEGAVAITRDEHAALLKGNSEGKRIGSDDEGRPLLLDPLPLTGDELAVNARAWRDGELDLSDRVVSRHRDETEEGVVTTLTAEQYAQLQIYRMELRNWPASKGFPLIEHRPSAPAWILDLHK
ncbi:phage tail protein [Pseudomonas putida]|uniref:Phage tail protein n=2 Tax=Pseudomonas putida TaxID=303 RepID=A0A2Z4RQA3_PSEPU|nr:phage tail protein [Pseudomonas putida]